MNVDMSDVKDKLSHEDIEALVRNVEYLKVAAAPEVTICAITTTGGFTVVGMSAPINPSNFVEDIGKEVAYKKALDQLWALEGYRLKDERRRIIRQRHAELVSKHTK